MSHEYQDGEYLFGNDMNIVVDAIEGNGVVSGGVVTLDTGMTVDISSGSAIIAGTLVEFTGTSKTLSNGDSSNPRKDIITVNNVGTVSVVEGTPAVADPSGNEGRKTKTPSAPLLPSNSVILAEIWVDSSTTSLLSTDLWDMRVLTNPEKFYQDFDTSTSNPTHQEGRLFYDNTKDAISYYNNNSDITVNLGQEVLFKVENQTGSIIPNGSVIYPDGTTIIGLAIASDRDKSRIIAVATHDIANGATGYATKLGQVGGLDTSSYSEGEILYLSDTTAGAFTNVMPEGGSFVTVVGVVDVVHATNGIITVDTHTSDTSVEVTDTNGFPTSERTNTSISFTDGTRTFEISATSYPFHYYQIGHKYTQSSADSIVITDVTGDHIIYYDGDTLSEMVNPTNAEVEDVILNHCIVAYIYWNSTTSKGEVFQDERHGISMSPATHAYLHTTRGAQYVSGLAVGDLTFGSGSSNADAQFSITSGQIRDEDLTHDLNSIASTVGLKYYYRSGANGDWVSATSTGYSFPVGATPLPQYNEFTGATWQLTEVGSGNYMLIHVFSSGNVDGNPVVFIGENEYATLAGATAGAQTEIGYILTNQPVPEYVPIATLILEGKTAFTNTVNARYVKTSDGSDYVDFRTSEIKAGSTATNHNTLAGLDLAGSTITYGHVDDQAQTIAGVKTFSSFPVTPSSVPTTDYQIANKKYVDDNVGNDADAIHDNVSGEINAVTEKASPVSADILLIEDSADSYSKKKVQIGNLPSSGGVSTFTALTDTPSSFSGQSLKAVRVNSGESALEFYTASSGGGASAYFERKQVGSIVTGNMIPIPIMDEHAGLDIKEVRVSVGGLPTGANIKVQVYKRSGIGATATTDSIFTSDATLDLTTTETGQMVGCNVSGATVGTTSTTIDSARDTLSADDVLYIGITQVGSTIAGTDIVVGITVA